jgi:hypothetical protein
MPPNPSNPAIVPVPALAPTHIIQVSTAIVQHLSGQVAFWKATAEKARDSAERAMCQNSYLQQINQEQQIRIAELEARQLGQACGGVERSGPESYHSMTASLTTMTSGSSLYLEQTDQPAKDSGGV